MTRAKFPCLEHVIPVHEFSSGKQGSPVQSDGGLVKLLANSIIAISVKHQNGQSIIIRMRKTMKKSHVSSMY